MPLIPQQDVIVISGPYKNAVGAYKEAPVLLQQRLEEYPPCRIISITCYGSMTNYVLTAVVETV